MRLKNVFSYRYVFIISSLVITKYLFGGKGRDKLWISHFYFRVFCYLRVAKHVFITISIWTLKDIPVLFHKWARIIGLHSIHTSLRSYVTIRRTARAKQLARLVRLVRLVFYKKISFACFSLDHEFSTICLYSLQWIHSGQQIKQIKQIKQISATLGLPLGGDSNNAMSPYVSSLG